MRREEIRAKPIRPTRAGDQYAGIALTDFTEDLKKFDVPTLILHGGDDQIVPSGASALLPSKIVKEAILKRTAPHVPDVKRSG